MNTYMTWKRVRTALAKVLKCSGSWEENEWTPRTAKTKMPIRATKKAFKTADDEDPSTLVSSLNWRKWCLQWER